MNKIIKISKHDLIGIFIALVIGGICIGAALVAWQAGLLNPKEVIDQGNIALVEMPQNKSTTDAQIIPECHFNPDKEDYPDTGKCFTITMYRFTFDSLMGDNERYKAELTARTKQCDDEYQRVFDLVPKLNEHIGYIQEQLGQCQINYDLLIEKCGGK